MLRWACISLWLLALAACSTTPVKLGPDSDPRVARELLADAARAGPVRLEVNGLPATADMPTSAARLGEQAARGVRGLKVRFEEPPAATASAGVVLVSDPPPNLRRGGVCGAAPRAQKAQPEAPPRLQAIFCDGGTF